MLGCACRDLLCRVAIIVALVVTCCAVLTWSWTVLRHRHGVQRPGVRVGAQAVRGQGRQRQRRQCWRQHRPRPRHAVLTPAAGGLVLHKLQRHDVAVAASEVVLHTAGVDCGRHSLHPACTIAALEAGMAALRGQALDAARPAFATASWCCVSRCRGWQCDTMGRESMREGTPLCVRRAVCEDCLPHVPLCHGSSSSWAACCCFTCVCNTWWTCRAVPRAILVLAASRCLTSNRTAPVVRTGPYVADATAALSVLVTRWLCVDWVHQVHRRQPVRGAAHVPRCGRTPRVLRSDVLAGMPDGSCVLRLASRVTVACSPLPVGLLHPGSHGR